ncbi:MAG: 6-N-hydroxylaminopurine resistance protein [Neisseriaceae bacterium]|nr:6-N-hydroxylaminopurine resistance protein [Neisseriaceae bacterium]MBP6862293.1 6-N-hydroxylaminopurine resistance protein [Neisseriaceae bacterium]
MVHEVQVYQGKVRAYTEAGIDPSAIVKTRASGVLTLTPLGLAEDEQAEKRFHGGPDRALCHYPREHYAYWRQTLPAIAERFQASAFGENLSTEGMTEDNVFIGDVWQWGQTLIQVTQPRSPCYKLNDHFGVADLSVQMQASGRCGWLYRVVGAGKVDCAEGLRLVARTGAVSVAEAIYIAFGQPFAEARCQRLLSAPGLSASWTKTMLLRLQNQQVEDFNRRLLNQVGG